MDYTDLLDQSLGLLERINAVIRAAEAEHARRNLPYSVYEMKYRSGEYVMTEMLHTKAKCLATITQLKLEMK